MKKLLIFAFLLSSLSTLAQTTTADRAIIRQSIYLRDRWIDTVLNDTANISGKIRSIMTADAVSKLINGRITNYFSGISGAQRFGIEDDTSFTSRVIFSNGNSFRYYDLSTYLLEATTSIEKKVKLGTDSSSIKLTPTTAEIRAATYKVHDIQTAANMTGKKVMVWDEATDAWYVILKDSIGSVGGGGNDDSAYVRMEQVSDSSFALARRDGTKDTVEILVGGGGIADGDYGDITVSSVGTVFTVDNDAITYAKIQNVSANAVLARATASPGDVQEVALSPSNLLGRGSTGNVAPITIGAGLSLTGTELSASGGGGISQATITDTLQKYVWRIGGNHDLGGHVNPFFGTLTNRSIPFKTNNVLRAVLDSTGNWCIGCAEGVYSASTFSIGGGSTDAQVKFHVNGISNFNGVLSGSFYTNFRFGLWDAIGIPTFSSATHLAIGGFRASQWQGVHFYSNNTLRASVDNNGFTVANTAGTGTRVATWSSAGLATALANGTDGHVLTLVAGAPAWAAPAGGGSNIYNSNGTIDATRTVGSGGFQTTWSGSNSGIPVLTVTNSNVSANSLAINATANNATGALKGENSSSGYGTAGISSSGNGGYFQSTSGIGLQVLSSTNLAGTFLTDPASTNVTREAVRFIGATQGTAQTGLGVSSNYYLEGSDGTHRFAGAVEAIWSDIVEPGQEQSSLRFHTTTAGVSAPKVTIDHTGAMLMTGRLQTDKGANVASTGTLSLGLDGNLFVITGTTTINDITTSAWQAGSEITLVFTGVLTVKHNTTASGTKMMLAGSVDMTTANHALLTLIYDGTQWQEKSRKIP
jgi:hypothetical protein